MAVVNTGLVLNPGLPNLLIGLYNERTKKSNELAN
jgi:hypothetical protein